MSPPPPAGDRRPTVVFCSHAAERTGPPLVLHRFLEWLGPDAPFDVELVFGEGGDLLDDFARFGRVHVLDEYRPPAWVLVSDSVLHRLRLGGLARRLRRAAIARRLAPVGDHDLVYVNTAGSVRALRYLPDRPRRVLTHVHELEIGLRHHLHPDDLALILEVTDHFVTVADAVTEAVVGLGVDPGRITRRYGFVSGDHLAPSEDAVAAARDRLGLPEGTLVVGASGLTHWRKAPDLFLLLAQVVRARLGDRVHFVWVGGEPDDPSFWPYRYDLEQGDLAGAVTFVPHVEDPSPYFATFDVFVLTSREDAFPLVGLEAAAVGLPLTCFETGGMPELIGPDGGAHVPYPDVDALATAVVALLEDPEARRRAGEAVRARVRERHLAEVQGPGILADIEAVLHGG